MTQLTSLRTASAEIGTSSGFVVPAGAPTRSNGSSDHQVRTLRDIRGGERPKLLPETAALIIIDAQREYVDGRLRLEGMSEAISEIVKLRTWARGHGVPVIVIQQVSPATSTVFAEGSQGVELVAELTPTGDETVIRKLNPNAFHRTELKAMLDRLGRRQVILTGFMAHMCLDSTARAAFDLGYDVFVVRSATADRAIPGPDGRITSAKEFVRVTMAALNDRFAWIVATAAVLAEEAG